jgi:hypothetical protein
MHKAMITKAIVGSLVEVRRSRRAVPRRWRPGPVDDSFIMNGPDVVGYQARPVRTAMIGLTAVMVCSGGFHRRLDPEP